MVLNLVLNSISYSVSSRHADTSHLLKESSALKLPEKYTLENCSICF